MKTILSRCAPLVLSTLFSGCIFVTTCVFATTMTLTDTEITSRLHHEISKDKDLSGLKIHPLVIQGVVNLKGTVNSIHQVIDLIALTEKMEGVTGVDTKNLILKTTQKPLSITDDLYISEKLKDIYEKNKVFGSRDLDALGISVDAKDGTIILSGQINERRSNLNPEEYRAQMKKAVELARKLKGVQDIDTDKLVLVVQYTE